jgi:hypothetical protein
MRRRKQIRAGAYPLEDGNRSSLEPGKKEKETGTNKQWGSVRADAFKHNTLSA